MSESPCAFPDRETSPARRFRVVAEWPSVEADDEDDACGLAWLCMEAGSPLWTVEELPAEKGDETA